MPCAELKIVYLTVINSAAYRIIIKYLFSSTPENNASLPIPGDNKSIDRLWHYH